MDLQITSETFRHELYTSSGSSQDLSFAALVTQQAAVKPTENKLEDTAGADAALANLKQSLASFAQEKEAKKYVKGLPLIKVHFTYQPSL